MIRVLHLIAPAPAGGAETVVTSLAHSLAATGIAATIGALVPNEDAHPFIAAAEARGIRVDRIHVRHRRYLDQATRTANAAAAVGAQLIHTHGYQADVIGALARRAARVPVVCTLHGFTGSGLMMRLQDVVIRWSHRQAAAVVAVSVPIATRLRQRGVQASRIALIPNAAPSDVVVASRHEARTRLGVPTEGPRIGWIGRLSEEKGADVMIRALSNVPVEVRLSIVGDGALRGALKSLAAELGVGGRIDWHGLRADAAQSLPAFDVLVLCSRTEGTPMVLLEAMAARTPIVATEVGGVPLMLSAAEAILVPSERPDAIARAVQSTLADGAAARRRAEAARARLERDHDITAWARAHAELYTRVLASR